MFKWLLIILWLALLYFVAGKLSVSLALSVPPNNVTSLWLPAPIGLAAILLLGNLVWLGIWLGDFLVNFPSYFQAVHYLSTSATSQGKGTFIRSSLNDSLLLLQSFNGVIALTTLLLAAVLAERARTRKALIASKEQLETRVEERTATLVQVNEQLKKEIMERRQAETALRESEGEKNELIASLQAQTQKLETTLQDLKKTQAQLIQNEKMWSLGQLVAGIAHEINNPISFIYGNLTYVSEYTNYLLKLILLYQKHYSYPPLEIAALLAENELDFILEDLPQILNSMNTGANRISNIVQNLRTFSRLNETGIKAIDINESITNTLLILEHRLKLSKQQSIEVIKQYGVLPKVQCYPGELNQVFMNIISNAIDALQESIEFKNNPQIIINTELTNNQKISISIKDTALGMTEEVRRQIFNPFFTTKPAGKGTGLGLAVSHKIIVEKHKGEIKCISTPGEGTEFIIEIPLGNS